MHHGTLFKRIYNNYSPGLFPSSYVQAKLAEVGCLFVVVFLCGFSVYMYMLYSLRSLIPYCYSEKVDDEVAASGFFSLSE